MWVGQVIHKPDLRNLGKAAPKELFTHTHKHTLVLLPISLLGLPPSPFLESAPKETTCTNPLSQALLSKVAK